MNYRQCKLIKEDKEGKPISELVCYLNEKLAKKNKYVLVDTLEGLWKVAEVYQSLPEEIVLKNSQDYKHQRKESDV